MSTELFIITEFRFLKLCHAWRCFAIRLCFRFMNITVHNCLATESDENRWRYAFYRLTIRDLLATRPHETSERKRTVQREGFYATFL
jgi:hypothetical protein